MKRDFINYDSKVFIKTLKLIKKYELYTFYYIEGVTPKDYEDDDLYEVTLDICNRLCGYSDCGLYTKEDICKIIEEIFDFWHGNITKTDVTIKNKIVAFWDELSKYYKNNRNEKSVSKQVWR